MLGLIKKDLLLLKDNIILILVFVLMLLMMVSLDYTCNVIPFCEFFFIILIFSLVSTFSQDSKSNLNGYAATFSKGRKNVVTAKYLVSILLILILAGISFGLWSLEVLINYRGSFYYLLFESIIPFTVWTICAMIVFISIFYPLVFKFGVSKAMIIFAFVTVLSLSMDWFEENIETVFKFFTDQPDSGILLTILSLGGSYFLSRIIYSRKEF